MSQIKVKSLWGEVCGGRDAQGLAGVRPGGMAPRPESGRPQPEAARPLPVEAAGRGKAPAQNTFIVYILYAKKEQLTRIGSKLIP
ncbi:MAG: hypothetical protein H6581_30055 [Bacteroidia bacterium]|nr:hypothetical protein [Bacteroidia bacterium]